MQSLESVLNDEPEVVEEVKEVLQVEEPIKEVHQDEAEETTAEEIKSTGEKPEEDSTPEPKTDSQAQQVPVSALMAERKQRQELEQRLAQFEQNKEPVKAPDVFDDQEGFTSHIEQQFNHKLNNAVANISQMMASREYPDLDEKMTIYNELAQNNPGLQNQVMKSVSPYHEAYAIVEKHEKLQKMENIDEYEAKVRAEIEAKVRAEIQGETKSQKTEETALRDSIPTSLAGQPSKGNIGKPAWSGPASLETLFNDG